MSSETMQTSIEHALTWRYATKRFDPTRKIAAKEWNTLENALQMAPSSFGLQPWHFVVVTNAALREKLQAASWNQPQLVEASHIVVLAARTSIDADYIDEFLKQSATERGVSVDNLTQYRQMMVDFTGHLTNKGAVESWATHQTYIALGMLLETAALLGIDACPLEGINAGEYDSLLGLPSKGYSTKVACALGYRSSSDAAASLKKIRHPKEKVFSYHE
jgi:nitroreductase